MTNVKRGEVWLVNLDPAIGREIKKTRPAVIVQNDVGNQYSPLTIIAPITSHKGKKVYPFEVLLPEICGLEKQSKVLLSHIRTIDKSRLVKKMASLDDVTLGFVDDAIKISFGL
jgi:mRNA interferase MazF